MNQSEKIKESLKDKFKKITQTKFLIKVMYGLYIIIIIAIIFQAGVFVGFHKAQFNENWGRHYENNFGPRSKGMLGHMPGQFPTGHGTIGKIVKVDLPNIIVVDSDNVEKVIVVDKDTSIISMGENMTTNDLKVDGHVVVIGSPNDQGQIIAKFIRIMPSELNNPLINN
ncbi:MAG: hypothetical protein KGI58_03810 [Patescibacteria group bacterium]|nr:hypothetical protein [Patescibacteria group bacterium]